MIITCKECNSSFNVDDGLIKETGSKVRCSKCETIFLAYPHAPEDDLFFHLEDDWILEEEVEIESLLKYFDDDKIFAVNLRAYGFSGPRPCLLPSMYRKSFCEKFITGLKATANSMFYSDSSGAITELSHGADGQVLTSNGTTSAPSWESKNNADGGFSNSVYRVEDAIDGGGA